jgi:hypothetical protein
LEACPISTISDSIEDGASEISAFAGIPLNDAFRNHAIKRDPRTGMRSADNNWDFWTLLPEALHQVTIVMSDRGIPKSFRHMHGFGSHAYSFLNAAHERIALNPCQTFVQGSLTAF